MMHAPEQFRDNKNVPPALMSTSADGNNGVFTIFFEGRELNVIASDGMDWDHVSVSLTNRIPNWREICLVKELFWDKDDCVVQYHPPESEYVNNHKFCLHLWRPQKEKIPMPESILVGFKE